MINLLSENPSLINTFVAEMRNVEVQGSGLRFRKNLERLGNIFAYEISRELEYGEAEITTPLGISEMELLAQQPVVASIMRAGLPMHQGMLDFFDHAESAFVSAYRKHHKDGSFEIHVDYVSVPSLEGRSLIVCDPMVATGSSMVESVRALTEREQPEEIHIATIIAAQDGLDYVRRHLPEAQIWVAAIDEELTAKSYIVPGLGDAGDLAFGEKD